MKRNRYWVVLTLWIGLGALAVGCGGDDTAEPSTDTTRPRRQEMRGVGGISLRLGEPRIKPIEESEWTDVERAFLGPIQEERGSVPNIYRTFARHPEIFTPRLKFGRHLQRGSTLPARDRVTTTRSGDPSSSRSSAR